nr:2',3'-cyclic-nucleotide 3'-phosphodiesterase-like [Dermacentor andersoni]
MEAAAGDGAADCPTDTTQLLDRVEAPCLKHEPTMRFMRTHGRLFVLVRGPPGSGKNIVAAELEELYPGCRAYWSDKLFSSPVAPERSTVSIRESHDLCLSKIEGFMKNDVPMIINRNTNVMVWEIAKFLVLASRYGYTVILVDMPHHFVLDPKVLTATNNKGLGEPYITNRVRQWEEVYPFATGWSPRPKDAARLLLRFRQLRKMLHEEDPTLAPKDVASSHVFPFCLARVCVFGRITAEGDYCSSDKVKAAYGRSDTVRVFGYAVTRGFVFAMAELTEEQASLVKGHDHGGAGGAVGAGGAGGAGGAEEEEVDALTQRMCLSLSPYNWEDVACIVDLAKFAPEECGAESEEDALRHSKDRIELKGTQPSRITIMPLGSVEGTQYSYSRAVGAPWALLASKLRAWTTATAEGAAKKVGDVHVYAATETADEACCLLVDDKTVELEVVFTGYYQPHTTTLSRNTWSVARNPVGGRPRRRGGYARYY